MWFEWGESGAAHFIRQILEGSMGGMTPTRIANEWTLPQIAALYQDAETRPRDPMALRPGERYLSSAEAAAIKAKKRK